MEPYIHVSSLLDIYLVVPPAQDDLISLVMLILDPKELSFKPDFLEILCPTDVDRLKSGDEIFETHPEGAIVVVGEVGLHEVFHFSCPQLGVVTPVALPLNFTPGVPDI
jgi:hypothetical protein